MRKPGCIEPVFYFVCGDESLSNPRHSVGYILLAPYTGGGDRCEFPPPPGYRLEYADTLAAVDILERKLYEQEFAQWRQEAERDENLIGPRLAEVRDRLYQRMTSSTTSEYEKEFIRLYLQCREDRRAHHRNQWLARDAYLYARHYDIGNREAGEEVFKPDRIEVKT